MSFKLETGDCVEGDVDDSGFCDGDENSSSLAVRDSCFSLINNMIDRKKEIHMFPWQHEQAPNGFDFFF